MTMPPTLNDIAADMIGDGKEPNLFFIAIKGETVMITNDVNAAYNYWEEESNDAAVPLYDRTSGLLVETILEPSTGRYVSRFVTKSGK